MRRAQTRDAGRRPSESQACASPFRSCSLQDVEVEAREDGIDRIPKRRPCAAREQQRNGPARHGVDDQRTGIPSAAEQPTCTEDAELILELGGLAPVAYSDVGREVGDDTYRVPGGATVLPHRLEERGWHRRLLNDTDVAQDIRREVSQIDHLGDGRVDGVRWSGEIDRLEVTQPGDRICWIPTIDRAGFQNVVADRPCVRVRQHVVIREDEVTWTWINSWGSTWC
jgi:hypothetical protein